MNIKIEKTTKNRKIKNGLGLNCVKEEFKFMVGA